MKQFVAMLALALATPALAQQEPSRWDAQIERDWADLPPAAQDVPIPQGQGYLVREIAPRVFVVTEGLYQALFVVTDTGVVVVDAPPTIGRNLSRAIAETTNKPVTHVIYSHSHSDHIGAADQFGPGTVRIASAEVNAKLVRLSDPRRPAPTEVLDAPDFTLIIGDVPFRLDVRGPHHEPGNLYVYLPDQKVLMVVDIVYPGWVPFTNLGMAEDVQGFIDAHDAILGYDFDIFIGGHLSRPGTRADVETARAYVTNLIAAARDAQQRIDFGAVATETGYANRWLLVKTYMDRVADACTTTMLERWAGRLGGAAVSTPGHCWIMQEHLNINGLPASAAGQTQE
ncbi:MBL fold metallo-hydrolase [Qipengyuania qiaonensis]|uniref:MBL fold metallo-hydrolase n=1 Tax=Qipengyuania qiaonensis TaxID=2867240 RepID=A0ABS7J4A1_9SPHN|nr:MBL fold metallo-hydrolase [Qipengyuania qiaonensis]MBX7481713.1 MBL fold metallo-hydrolase [Qipengyuania qiaonensis]